MTTYTINLNPICQLSDEQFYQLCRQNPDIKLDCPASLSGEEILPEFILISI